MIMTLLLAFIFWDPNRFAFTMPIIDRPVAWYGICFAIGFVVSFFLVIPIIQRKLEENGQISERDVAGWPSLIRQLQHILVQTTHPLYPMCKNLKSAIASLPATQTPNPDLKAKVFDTLTAAIKDPTLTITRQDLENFFPKGLKTMREICLLLVDRLTWFIVIGTVAGARLGHVFFYGWPHFQQHPLDILKIWEGGLASHGGTLGVIIALVLYQRTIRRQFPELTVVSLLDIASIPAAMAAFWIRIGNFINQEIIGTPTTLPWAIVFGHPADGSPSLPRHPTQLYEAIAYLSICVSLFLLWKRYSANLKEGTIIGLFMILVFGSRFLIEFVKSSLHSQTIDESFLSAGQYLSIPFILFGCILLFLSSRSGKHPAVVKSPLRGNGYP
ncbi:MAG: prolipoprotein diacylglyceryl transferase [Waddliaceae bacterium]